MDFDSKVKESSEEPSTEGLETAPCASVGDACDIESAAEQVCERTLLADRLLRLKDATMRAVRRRERLPQPLFWSLFHTEVAEIRKKRAAEQKARIAFLRGENSA